MAMRPIPPRYQVCVSLTGRRLITNLTSLDHHTLPHPDRDRGRTVPGSHLPHQSSVNCQSGFAGSGPARRDMANPFVFMVPICLNLTLHKK